MSAAQPSGDNSVRRLLEHPRSGPTVLRIVLGTQLRRLRESRGLTPKDADYGIAPPEAHGLLGVPGETAPEPTYPGAYQEFYASIVRTLRDGAPPPTTLADAITGLEVIEAAARSAREPTTVHLDAH